ncbi:MAG TPA: MBL fold metallo-hydrolase [Thermoplasmata archaeon]|jgi:hydroxyacylglutathione hydrolase|nr:MAG TPA: MBL fold metallo-hydrolase [Thermoplasmata archaeon]
MDIFTILGRDYDSNMYVVVGEVPTIIDTGTGFYTKTIIKTIQKIVKLHQIQQILLTHEHYDHVGGVQELVRATQGAARVFAHKDVVSKLKAGKSTFAEMLGGVMPKIDVDVPLIDGKQLVLGDQPFEVLTTPGHSIGSLCFYSKKCDVLFSGDTIFSHGGFGRYDFPGGDFNSLVQSIERLAKLNVKNLYPGHGSIVETNGADHVSEALINIQALM